ncbi:MAG TPA: 3-oxoacyl-[acyl-carrier-protein] synthase III C-terminal domain-containing protein [Fibrobacteria bacterium]|nr:3-oxoacyl-[acyl-carrier-protein] synthase III C-terminal domain-containing protein [Fibrobacteria bacterium]
MGTYPEAVPAAYLSGFRVLRPEYSASNEEGVDWLSRAHARAEAVLRGDPAFDEEAFRVSMARYVRRFGCGPDSLSRRGHDLPDFLHLDFPRMRLFGLAPGRPAAGAGMADRMAVFAEIAKAKAEAFYPEDEVPPRDILHVTCTGYVAPGSVQEMVAARGWQDRTGVTHVYHMGCYAAMPAARIAAGYLASKGLGMPAGAGGEADDRVDIVHTEACTLHLDPTRHDPEQLVVQSLFADGHIRYSLRSRRGEGPALALLGVREALVPGSLGAMGWLLGDRGMRMSLSREVPELISGALKGFLRGLFAACGVDAAEAFGKGVFAVHPGGPRIIDKVAELLELSPGQVATSRAVLRDFGNMSSATLPHIWERMAADPDLPAGTPVTSLAFGPGLTVYGAMLRKA